MKRILILFTFLLILTGCKENTQPPKAEIKIQESETESDDFNISNENILIYNDINFELLELNNFGIILPIPLGYNTTTEDFGGTVYFNYDGHEELEHIEIGVMEIPNTMIKPQSISGIYENAEPYWMSSYKFHHNSGGVYDVKNNSGLTSLLDKSQVFSEEDVYVSLEHDFGITESYIEYFEQPSQEGLFEKRKHLVGEIATGTVKLTEINSKGTGKAYVNILMIPHLSSEYVITVLSPTTKASLNDNVFSGIIDNYAFFDPDFESIPISFKESDFLRATLKLPYWKEKTKDFSNYLINEDSHSKLLGTALKIQHFNPDKNIETQVIGMFYDNPNYIYNSGIYTSFKGDFFNTITVEPSLSSLSPSLKNTSREPSLILYKVINTSDGEFIVSVIGSKIQEKALKSLINAINP